jgi:hypothetical protein
MTAQVATTTHHDPGTALAHAVNMATLVTEAAVKIGTTDVRPCGISARQSYNGAYPWTVEVQVDTPAQVDEIGRVFALPLIDYSPQLHMRSWDGVSLAGHLVTIRVYSGRRA